MIINSYRPVLNDNTNNYRHVFYSQKNIDRFIPVKTNNNTRFTGLATKTITDINRLEYLLNKNKGIIDTFFNPAIKPDEVKELSRALSTEFADTMAHHDMDKVLEFGNLLLKTPSVAAEILKTTPITSLKNLEHNDILPFEPSFNCLLQRLIREKKTLEVAAKIQELEQLPNKMLLNICNINPFTAEKLVMDSRRFFSSFVIQEMPANINTVKIILNNKFDNYKELLTYTGSYDYDNRIPALKHACNKGPDSLKQILDGISYNNFITLSKDFKDLSFSANLAKYFRESPPEYIYPDDRNVIIAKSLYNSLKEDKLGQTPFKQWNTLKDEDKEYIKSTIEELNKSNSICSRAKGNLINYLTLALNSSKI